MSAAEGVHPALVAAFSVLNRSAVRWCLLRGEAELNRVGEDLDILVAESDLAAATSALQRLDYIRLAAWGRGSHRFFLTYDTDCDCWIKIDMVSTLAFGPDAVMETNAAEASLDRRQCIDGVPLLADDDRFWALLLHCILDRGDVPERHATALQALAEANPAGGPLGDWFTIHAPLGWGMDRVIALARKGDWPSLVAVGRQMRSARQWRSRRSLAVRASRGFARRMTKFRTMALEPGLTIALLGPDGSGKSTLAAGLARTFYFPVRSVYMGLYGAGSASGRPPRGMVGRLARQWTGYARATFHRYRGRLVVYDRFGYDALLAQPMAMSLRTRVRRWVLSHAVPSPDMVLLLDAPPAMLRARKQDQDVATLESQRGAYLDLASRIPAMCVVPADRSADTVRRAVTTIIFQRYVERKRGRAPRRG